MTTTIIIGLLIPLLGTMLGSAFVFSNLSTIGFAIGFVLMMVLDVVMG